jgi:hypothetical protein
MKKIFMFLVIILSLVKVTNGSQIMIGLHFKDIIFWRFWQSDNGILKEKMLILNERNESINAKFMIAKIVDVSISVKAITDSSLGIVGGPWQIPAHGYQIVSMPNVPDSIENKNFYVYEVTCSNSDRDGLMEIHNAKPIGNFSQNKIITTMGINGSGSSHGNFWCEYNSLFAASGEYVNVRLTFIPRKLEQGEKDSCYIQFTDPTDSIYIPIEKRLKLIKVESGNLPIQSNKLQDTRHWSNSQIITFPPPNANSEYPETYSVDFILQAPQTSFPEIRSYYVQIVRGNDGGNLLALIILPKGN